VSVHKRSFFGGIEGRKAGRQSAGLGGFALKSRRRLKESFGEQSWTG